MKNFLQVNRALVAEKKHLLLNQSFGTVGSPNQTGETLTRENRIGLMSYLHRTLMLLFAVLVMSVANVGMAWGKTWNVSLTGSGVTQDGITLTGDYAANASVGSNSKKANSFNTNNSSAYIFSEQKNITAISFTICRNTNVADANNAVTVATSTGGAFAVQTSNFTATNNGSSISSLTNIQAVGNNQANQNTIIITFADGYPVQAVELRKASASLIFNISVTYEDETLPSSIFNATISGSTPAATVTPAGTSLTLSVNSSSPKTIGSDKYYQWNKDNIISLGSGKFQVGDIIIADVCGSGNNKAAGFTVNEGSTEYIVTFCASSHGQVFYTVSAGDGVAGQSSVTLKRKSSDTYVHAFRVLRAGASCSDPGLAYETETVNKTEGDANFTNTLTNAHGVTVSYASSDDEVAEVNSSTGEVTIVGAGTATITASSLAQTISTVDYCADNASYTLKVARDPVGSGHTLTWEITTVSGSSENNVSATTDIGTGTKTPTSSYLTSMTNLTGVGVNRTTSGKNSNTGKIETPTSYDGSKYVTMTFAVASGYQFTPSSVSIKTVAVKTTKDLKFEISDAKGSYSVTKTGLSTSADAATNTLDFSSCDRAFTGTVTVKIYVYGADDTYRLSTPLVITGTVEEEVASGCSDWGFYYGTDKQSDWDKTCFTQVGSTTEWQITGFVIPDKPNWYVDNSTENDAKKVLSTWSNLYFALSQGDGSRPMVGNTATGAVGTVRIYDNSTWNNRYAGFIPDGYKLKFGSTYKNFAVHDGNEYRSEIVEYSSSTANDNVSVGIVDGSGDYVSTDNTEEMRHIFLNTGGNDLWSTGSASNFGIYDVTNGNWKSLMVKVPGEDYLYEGWIPSNCTTISFHRLASSTPKWKTNDSDGTNTNVWNSTGDKSLETGKNVFTISGWDNDGGNSGGSWSAYEKKGKFRMNADWTDKNWYVRFYPYNVLSYDANGGSGAPAAQSVAADGNSAARTVAVAAGSGMTAPTGYYFYGWNSNKSQADAGTKDDSYDPSDNVTLSADVTLYAVWKPILVTAISVSPSSKTLDVSETVTLSATATPSTALDKTVTWSSDNTGVATVNESGVVTAVAPGSCTITATAHDGSGITATCAITVSKISPNTYAFSADNTSICSGGDVTFTIAGSQVGATYYVTKSSSGGSAIGDSKAGTGFALSFTVSSATTGDYYCFTTETTNYQAKKVSNSKVTISYKTATSISSQPTTPVAATVGSACSITGLVAAGTSPTYQWYTCNSDGSSATAIDAAGTLSFTGYTTATLGLTPTATGATYYKCVVSGSCGDPVTSSVVTVNASAAATLYTVTFNSNGGSAQASITQASEDASIEMPSAPTYASHTFQGWVIGGTTYAAGDPYTPTADITAYASWKADCAGGGGGGSGTTLFSQDFNSATTIYVKNTTNVAKSLDGTNGINILGSTAASQFTSFYGDKKSDAGFGLNNTNANDTAFNAAFGVYANNTGYKYCLAKTTNFSATPPTAIKVVMHMKLKGLNGQNGAAVLGFAVGSGFNDKTSMNGQKTDSIHSAFSFNNHTTNHTITSYNTTTSISGDNVIADNTEVTITWVINNSGIALNYSDPASGETELGNDKFDVWVGSTKYVAGQSANNGAKALRQLIIGDPSGKKHVFTLNDITVTDLSPAGGGCYYVTYDGNGADGGSVTDAVAHANGSNVTVLGNTDTPAAFTKTGYRFNGWNTSATGKGTAYAAGGTISSISADMTLYAQWVADACSAPSAPTISGTSVRTVGQTITLNAACASGADASTTYTWFKGVDWATASAASPVQEALTAGEGGRIFNKASCVAGDAGTYWCEASNGDGCDAHNATGFTVTVNDAAGDEHIYFYKDDNHYSDGVYSDPEGNTASSGDNKSLSSPWMICNGCKAGVDSVVAHGATYDGKGNHMNAYIKLPTGGNATTKNIKFALTAGYTGTLKMKIGGYENNPTVTLQPLNTSTGVLGDAISYSGTVSGVATTENNFGEITWNLTTPGGTYVLTVTTKTGYISQIDMTTSTSATFNVTYNGNDNTGGTVPTDATNYASGATVTAAANSGTLVKTNYTGAGWNTANNGTGTNYVPGTGTFKITANTTLYAHWTQLITLAPGTQGTGTNNAAVSWNGSVLRGFAAHTASGYALQGYYTEPTGGTKVLNADGSFAATNIDGFVTSGKWSNTAAAPTLYAQWEASNLLKWNLKVNVSETSITTLSKESAAPTVIAVANMINLTNNGSLTITGSAKSGLTSKIATTTSDTGDDAGKYMSVQFIVAAGYQLVPSDIKVKVQPISHSQTAKLILEDNNLQSISYTSGSLSKGSTHTVTMTNSEEVTFTGTVTLKIYVYGTAESDGYRLGTPIEINGSVEATCATPPTFGGLSYDATEYTVGASASAIEVTGAENVNTYAWKQNDVNDRSGGEAASGTNNAVSYTPPTGTIGTKYYWCEMTNTACGITIKTPAVGITVRNATTDPTVTWSDVKLNDATATPNYGGGNYVLRATVNETSWPGTLAASMVTAPAGITIHHVTTGKADNQNYIEFKFDVTTAFDRASNATIDFNLALPEAGSYSALNSEKSVTYSDCSGGAAGQVAIKMGATASTSKSNPQNYWETAGAGRLMFNYGSNMGSTNNSSGYETADSTFYYYAASTGQKWMFQTYIGGVNKVRVVFRAAGTIKSSKATITNFYYNTEYFASPGSNAVSFGEVSASKAGYSSGEDGYIEFTVPEMAANSYGAFVTGDGNMKVYGVVLYSENAGDGGSVATNPAWSDSKADEFTVNKTQSDANFRYTISTTTNTLGAISYSSSKPSVAAVDPVTGEVTITATGTENQSAVITATLARSGCYQGATRTYTINVTGSSCSDVAGTITTEDLGCDGIKMTLSGYTEGASIQWYKDGATIADDGDDAHIYTTTAAGKYYAVTHKDCDRTSNTVEVKSKTASAERAVEKWYIKNGRPTPDIKLWTLGEGTHLTSVAWSPDNGSTGLTGEEDIYERDGAVWLTGRQPNTNSGDDVSYTLTLTANTGCDGTTVLSDASKKITIVHQKNTDKHVLAFVVNGTAKGGFTEGITAAQTTSVSLYNTIAAQFDVQATNIYSTDDEQKLREYYSQYDILCITDYPNTQTKGANSKSYVDAIGALIDIRPILTMEAFVSSLANWKAKGISGNPKSPTTRQYTMDLQCKDHEIFSGVTTTKMGEGDEAMYRVTMVDKNQEEYKTLDANYGDGEHKSNEGYQYGKKPALQGFTYTEAMSDNDLLPLGLIDDGADNDLQVGIERQHEMSARMMVLGINSYAMERLTNDGKTIVINALKYLMKKNAEDISDCSVYFDGSDKTDSTNWDNELNWGPNYSSLPLYNQEVRILKPCVVKDGTVARASGIKIIPSGRINHNTDNASGSLTIEPGGALIVDGEVRAATAPNYFNAYPTTPGNLVLQSNSSAQAALILNNSKGETQATVEMYNPSHWDTETYTKYWSYVGVPIEDVNIGEYFYNAFTYLHTETEGWIKKGMYTQLHPFEGIGLSMQAGNKETFYGTLASTEDREIALTCTSASPGRNGKNIIGNSWTAPIQIANFEASDFGSAYANIWIFNTGKEKTGAVAATTENDGVATAGQWLAIPISVAGLAEYTGLKVIPAMQAFEVNTTAATTLNLNYDRLVRGVGKGGITPSMNMTEPMRAPRRSITQTDKPANSIEAMLRVRVSDSKTHTDVYLMQDGRFTDEFDNGWEAAYIYGDNRSPMLYAKSEIGIMSFLAKPDIEGTVLGFFHGREDDHTFSFSYTGSDVLYLNDLKLQTSTLISDENTYSFKWVKGDSAFRFVISRTPLGDPGIATGVTDLDADAPKVQKIIYNDKLYIIRGGKVFSADGQLVK